MLTFSYHQATNTYLNFSCNRFDDLLENNIFHDILKLYFLIWPLSDRFFYNEIVLVLFINNLSTSHFEILSFRCKFIKLHKFKLFFIPIHLILFVVFSPHIRSITITIRNIFIIVNNFITFFIRIILFSLSFLHFKISSSIKH